MILIKQGSSLQDVVGSNICVVEHRPEHLDIGCQWRHHTLVVVIQLDWEVRGTLAARKEMVLMKEMLVALVLL